MFQAPVLRTLSLLPMRKPITASKSDSFPMSPLQVEPSSRGHVPSFVCNQAACSLSKFWQSTLICFLLLALGLPFARGQTAFLDFNSVGQYTNNFNPWNENGASVNGGNY